MIETVTVTKIVEIAVIAVIVTEKGSVTKSVIAIVTVIVKEKESRKSQMVNTHSTTTRTKWTTTIWRWWIEVRSVDLLLQISIFPHINVSSIVNNILTYGGMPISLTVGF